MHSSYYGAHFCLSRASLAISGDQMYEKIFGSGSGQEADQEEDGDCHQDFAETYAGSERTREYIAKISFEQAFLGSSLTIQYRHVGVCDKCQEGSAEYRDHKPQ